MFLDFGYAIEGLLSWKWADYTQPTTNCSWQLKFYVSVATLIPFWFRLMQCLKKWQLDPANKTQLINALKYLSKMIPGFVVIFMGGTGVGFWVYLYF